MDEITHVIQRECVVSASLVTNGNATFRYFFNMINIDAGFLPPLSPTTIITTTAFKNHNFSFSNFECCCCCQSFQMKYIHTARRRKRAKRWIFVKWKKWWWWWRRKKQQTIHSHTVFDRLLRNWMPNHVLFAFCGLIYDIVLFCETIYDFFLSF